MNEESSLSDVQKPTALQPNNLGILGPLRNVANRCESLRIVAFRCVPTCPGNRARPGLPGRGRQAGGSLRSGPGNTGWHASAAEAWHQPRQASLCEPAGLPAHRRQAYPAAAGKSLRFFANLSARRRSRSDHGVAHCWIVRLLIVEFLPASARRAVLSDVQIQNANAANYYECARMKEEKRQDIVGKGLTDFGSVLNGSQRFRTVLNGTQRYSMVLNGTQWYRMVQLGSDGTGKTGYRGAGRTARREDRGTGNGIGTWD